MNEGELAVPSRRIEGPLLVVALLVFIACFYYVWAYIVLTPYPGLDFDAGYRVVRLDEVCTTNRTWCEANSKKLQVGDQLEAVGALSRERFLTERHLVPFAGYQAGELVPVRFVRDGIVQHAEWQFLGPTAQVRLTRIATIFFVLPFWLAGTGVLLFVRPRDRRWLLLAAFNYVSALWIVVGIASNSRIGLSAIVLRLLVLMMPPVYVHLHLLVPAPLPGRAWRPILQAMYGLAALLGLRELLWSLPSWVFYLCSLVAVGASLALLIFRSFSPARRSDRQVSRPMLVGVALGFGPAVLWLVPGLIGYNPPDQVLVAVTLVAIPLQPIFYVYAIYKQRLGNLEFRLNRLLSQYSFILLFGTAFLIVGVAASQWTDLGPRSLLFTLFTSVVFLVLALWLRDPFQRWIDRLAYGTELHPDTIIRTFADQIPRALDRQSLAGLLTREVLPALLIRQSALYEFSSAELMLVYSDGVPGTDTDAYTDAASRITRLLATPARYLPPAPRRPAPAAFDWVRLVIPIEVGGKQVAAWLLGRRDPDDFYPRPDIDLLKTLGNQIGVALETAWLFDNLHRRASELETAYRDLQVLDEMKDVFVQNISHELRTPLTFLRGYTDLMLEEVLGPVTGEQRQALTTISDRTEGIIRLVDEIISLQQARVDRLICEAVNLAALAHSCVEALEVAIRTRTPDEPQHTFRLDVSNDVPQIMGDRRRLAQVIDNLLNNAMKFSPNGGEIAISIRPCMYSRPGAAAAEPGVALDVADDGIGIPPAELDRIWQRFYQVDGSSRRRFGGMGLGLAIVRAIVEAHGGQICVESQVGYGTIFHVILAVNHDGLPRAGAGTAGEVSPALGS